MKKGILTVPPRSAFCQKERQTGRRTRGNAQRSQRRNTGPAEKVVKCLLVGVVLFVVHVLPVHAQGKPGTIELKSAKELKVRNIRGTEVRELLGSVHFIQFLREGGQVRVWSDRALQYLEAEQMELSSRVRVIRDSILITSDEGTYFGKERRIEVRGRVRLERSGSVLTSRAGEYFPDEKRAIFTDSVVVVDSASTLYCDKLMYWENEARSVASGNVRVIQSSDGTTVFGDTLVNLEREKRSIVPRAARMMQIDTAANGEVDTLLVTSRSMESRNDSVRHLIARDSVRIARTDLSARCHVATFAGDEDRITLAGDPVVWHEENQVTGDTIHIRLVRRQLSSVFVRGRAMAVSRSDSVRRSRFDQLTGRRLTMYFAEKKVRQIDVEQTATSLYYLYDEAVANGANMSSGDRIIIDFSDGQVDRIKIIGGVQGEYYPERMVRNREGEYNLDGFKWFRTRPKRDGVVMQEVVVE